MKIPALLTCLLAVFLAALPVRNAPAAEEVSFDVFYNNLADDGDWYNTPEYGYVWQPSIAYHNEKWRPYTDGYWAQTDDGWTWVSYENFGWACYHYGRWTRLKDVGWAWVPGYDWGPGWVSWRTSDDYVGWAPLPPKAEQGVYEGRVADRPRPRAETIDYNDVEPEDYGADADVQYDIGPQNYCFVDTHNFGAPVLGEVCLPPERNFVIIERTVNVTNIYRRRGPDAFVVYNRGPDFNFLSARSERPIQQLRIERHDDLGFLHNGVRGGGNANQVRGGVFSVAAPAIARAPINLAQVRPAKVKQNIDRAEVVHGWSHAGGDPAATERLREQFKQQAQQAPPPRRDTAALPPRGNEPAHAAGNVPPGAGAAGFAPQPFQQPNAGPRQPLTDAEKATRRDAAQRARDERQKTPGGAGPAAPGQGAPDRARGAGSNVQPVAPEFKTPSNGGGNGQGLTPEERKARRQQERAAQAQTPPATAGAGAGGQPFEAQRPQPVNPTNNPAAADADKAARRAQRQQEKAQQAQQQQRQEAPAVQPANPERDRDAARAQRQQEKAQQAQQQQAQQAQQQQAQQQQAQQANAEREARRAQRQQEQAAPPPRAPQPQADAPNPEREARRAQRQQEQSAPPQRAPQPQAAAPRPQPDAQAQPKGGDDDKRKRKDQ